ncbi:serine/threonine-protein phosphatase 6 regulatory ankyrin repeat subunit A [Microdochium nivale]|nr:serine/threonine-protein phosphatase 6 regulatory ankyrin repeat subunit A [Microdochium nivale]
MADLDLAYSCVDTAGAASASSVVINRLLRTRQDTPSQLRDLQVHTAAAKHTIEQLLSMIDSDTPAFQGEADSTALSGHLDDLVAIFRDVQEHAAKVAQSSRSIEKSTWTMVWPLANISASSASLQDKLTILTSYVDGSRHGEGSRQPTPQPNINLPGSSAALAAERQDSEASQSEPSIINEKTRLQMQSLGATAVSLGSTQTTTASPPPPAQDEHAGSTSAVDSPPQYEEAERQFQQMQIQQQQAGQSVSARRDTSASTQSLGAPDAGQSLPPRQQQVQLHGQMQPYQRVLASTQAMQRSISPSSMPVVDSAKAAAATNRFSMISARKMKSSLLLTKSNSFGTGDGGAADGTSLPQGDELFPDRFRDRVSNYSRGITPAWAPVTVPSKKKKKPDKQLYRNRFTNTKDLDVTPEHLTSHFKVIEKDIWDAILHRRPERVQEIMEHKWRDNIIVEKHDAVTALHVAAALGQCQIVKILLSLGANPNAPDRFELTPLHYAADFGCKQCVQHLITAGAQVDKEVVKQNIKTPLRYAVAMANIDAAAVLLERGALLHMQASAPDDTLLYAAVSTGDVALCDILLKAGANPKESFEVLSLAASQSLELLACLVGAGADVNVQGPPAPPTTEKSKKAAAKILMGPGDTLMHRYTALDNMQMVDFLLTSLKASPNVIGNEGRYPLHVAVAPSTNGGGSNSVLIAQALITHGANIEARNGLGQTPLQLAVLWGRADMAQLLCTSGASIDAADDAGQTPWTETQTQDYIRRSGPTPRAGPWSGGDFRSVAEMVSARRGQMRREQQKQLELRQQLQQQHQQKSPQMAPKSGHIGAMKSLPVAPQHNVVVSGKFGYAVELPLSSADSRPVQEVHGDSMMVRQRADSKTEEPTAQNRIELPS